MYNINIIAMYIVHVYTHRFNPMETNRRDRPTGSQVHVYRRYKNL